MPGFLSTLQEQLESLPLEALERVNKPGGLEVRDLLDFVLKPKDYTVDVPEDESPDLLYEAISEEAIRLGKESVQRGEVAFCVLAGGDGTRMGSPKAFLRLPGTKTSLLNLKMLQACGSKHVWIMSSPTNRKDVEKNVKVCEQEPLIFEQFESFRLTPDNQIFMMNGEPSFHPCGHGDVINSLKNNGMLQNFLESGGKYIVTVNVDNVYATLDPAIVGQHILSKKPITCEVTQHVTNDTGGILCNHMGFKQIVEKFRLSGHSDLNAYSWISTNSMVINADLEFDTVKWSWHRVKKRIGEKLLIQYERLLQDLTSTFQTQFIGVDRKCRYMPVKTQEDLAQVAKSLGKSAA